jgi:hypothetical protein
MEAGNSKEGRKERKPLEGQRHIHKYKRKQVSSGSSEGVN